VLFGALVHLKSLLRRRWAAGVVIATLLALCFLAPVRGQSKKGPYGLFFSVMTYNLWDLGGKRPELKDVEKVIRDAGVPDVLLLQDVGGEGVVVSLAGSLELPYHLYLAARGQNYGVSILSRYPLSESGFLYFKSSKTGRGALRATVVVDDRELQVCSVHLDRIDSVNVDQQGVHLGWDDALFLLAHETTDETVRSRSVAELLGWLGSESVVIGGDFNTVLCSKAIRKMETVFVDALARSSDYLTGTYIKSGLPVAPRLDFLFYSKDLECLRARVVKRTAGDHYPVWAKIGFGL